MNYPSKLLFSLQHGRRMQEFIYKPSFSFSFLIFWVLGLGAVIVSLSKPFKDMIIFNAPFSMYFLLGIGLILLGIGMFYFAKWLVTIKIEGKINLANNFITFPQYALIGSEQKKFFFDDVTELYVKEGSVFSVIIYTRQNNRYEFDSSYFQNRQEYNLFTNLMNQYCRKDNKNN